MTVRSNRQRTLWWYGAALSMALIAGGFYAAPDTAWAQADPESEAVAVDPQALHQQGLEAEWAGNYEDARQFHRQAAELGVARAHYQLGFLLLDGLGGPRDVDSARVHLRAAADGGVTLALVPYMYSYDDQDDPQLTPDPFIAGHALLELARRDLASAGDTIMFWSRPLKRQLQVYLRDAGHYRGAIDGLIGHGSLNALRAFARARSPLPELPSQRFARITITVDGITSDDQPTLPLSAIDEMVDARVAFAGAVVTMTDEGHWRISVDDRPLLDWPQMIEVRQESEDDASGSVFQLPGKPQRADLLFGMPLGDVAPDDLGVCALRVKEQTRQYVRRCETRTAGVHLEFTAANGPADDLDAQNSAPSEPYDERLTLIELSPLVALRLAGN